MRPRRPNAWSRRDGGDPAHQRRTDRRRAHRFGALHAAAGTGGGDQGGACDADGKQWPQADLTITANPIALDDETIVERVLLIGTRLCMPVHHVVIQDVGGRKSVALDLEVDSAMNLKSGPFDWFRPRGGHRRRGSNTALCTLG
jgi:hypothetical protein